MTNKKCNFDDFQTLTIDILKHHQYDTNMLTLLGIEKRYWHNINYFNVNQQIKLISDCHSLISYIDDPSIKIIDYVAANIPSKYNLLKNKTFKSFIKVLKVCKSSFMSYSYLDELFKNYLKEYNLTQEEANVIYRIDPKYIEYFKEIDPDDQIKLINENIKNFYKIRNLTIESYAAAISIQPDIITESPYKDEKMYDIALKKDLHIISSYFDYEDFQVMPENTIMKYFNKFEHDVKENVVEAILRRPSKFSSLLLAFLHDNIKDEYFKKRLKKVKHYKSPAQLVQEQLQNSILDEKIQFFNEFKNSNFNQEEMPYENLSQLISAILQDCKNGIISQEKMLSIIYKFKKA